MTRLTKQEVLEVLTLPAEEYRTVWAAPARELVRTHKENRLSVSAMLGYDNVCRNQCLYCGMRAGNRLPRYRYQPQEVLDLTASARQTGLDRLFLISGEDPKFPFEGLLRMVEGARGMGFSHISLACGEFDRGQSRIMVSADLLDGEQGLTGNLFVGLDEAAEQVGITIFSPALREESYLARKQEYLRNVESVVGLKRGMLSDANMEDRTATEIASSAGDYNLTVMDFQDMWQEALGQGIGLCAQLSRIYGKTPVPEDLSFCVDWGNGVLYDEDKTWESYRQMVAEGLLKPEIALGWRFQMPADTPEEQAKIRSKFMPQAGD